MRRNECMFPANGQQKVHYLFKVHVRLTLSRRKDKQTCQHVQLVFDKFTSSNDIFSLSTLRVF